jgi:hypothetical protein
MLQVLYSFDHLATANLGLLPSVISTSPNCAIAGFSGRDNSGCLLMTDGLNSTAGPNTGFNFAVDASQDLSIGMWVTIESVPGVFGILAAFGNPTVGPPSPSDQVISLVCTADGGLSVYGGEAGSVVGTLIASSPTGVMTYGASAAHYVEMRIFIAPGAAGIVQVAVDGVMVIGTNRNTQFVGVTTATHIMLGNPNGSTRTKFDDIYVLNGVNTGDGWIILKGVTQVDGKLVNAAGDVTQWTPTIPTGVNFTNVSEDTANTITYNATNTVGLMDLYNVEDVAYVPTAIQVDLFMRKTTSGPASVNPVMRPIPGGANFVATAKPLTTSFKYHKQVYAKNPNGDIAWTMASYNQAQIGVLKAE